MTVQTVSTENTATETTNATPASTINVVVAAPAVPKAPSKKSLALAIFSAALEKRKSGEFASNKAFRAAVLASIQTDLGVTVASAATMYNAAKKDAETADATVALGRDPKKEKAPAGTGKRGRPQGSKNKAKEAAAATAEPAPAGEAEVAPIVDLVLPAQSDSEVAESAVEAAPAEATA